MISPVPNGNPAVLRGKDSSKSPRFQNEISERQWLVFLGFVCAIILFSHLGRAALFEPDEGRNAEKGREILVTHDWITPHEDFLPILDKPIAFYWLVALSLKLFGVSEWPARLPSAVAAAG